MKKKHHKTKPAKRAKRAKRAKQPRREIVLVPVKTTRTKKMPMPPALARWHKRHKRMHSSSSSSSTKKKRRRSHAGHSMPRKKKHRGRRASGVLGRLIPTTHEAVSVGAAALYGKLEGDAAKDTAHFLRSAPTPLAMVGRSGNIALGLWVIGALTKQPLIRAAANGVVDVAAYQFMRRPAEYTKEDQDFKLSGGLQVVPDRTAQLVENYLADDDDVDDIDDDV